MMGRRLKHAQRYQDILTALIKNGFGFMVKDLGLVDFISNFNKQNAEADSILYSKSIGERIRLILEELGPTFVKLGQLASTRIDLIPKGIIKELEKLQDHVAPISAEEVIKIVEKELGQPIEILYKKFHEVPIASASIGQVHYAQLFSGQEVAIKVQRPHIEEKIDIDLSILADLAHLMEAKIEWAKSYRIKEIVEELSRNLKLELDYLNEARNGEEIALQLKAHQNILIPGIHWDLTTKKVLAMDYIDGLRLHDFMITSSIVEKKQIAKQFTDSMFQQIFIGGFFHGDPHPGNIFILPNNKIALIDFGMVGRLAPATKYGLASLIIALKYKDIEEVAYIITKIAGSDSEITDQLYTDIEDIIGLYTNIPLSQIHFSDLIDKVMQVSFRYHISMPPDLTILAKTLVTLEGILSQIDPDLAIIELAQPYGAKLIRERIKPKTVLKESKKKLRKFLDVLTNLLKNSEAITKDGKIKFEMDIPEIRELIQKLNRTSNQLSFSIILLAFSILMVGLIIGASISRVDTILWRFPVVEVGGIVATLMFLWLLLSIFKSGRF